MNTTSMTLGIRTMILVALTLGFACSSALAALVVDRDMAISEDPGGVEFAGDYTLTVGASIKLGKVVNDGHQAVVKLNADSVDVVRFQGLNGSHTRIEFNGGALIDNGGWGTAWFDPDATSTIELASISGNPILITHPNYQIKYLKQVSTVGTVKTSGEGRMEIAAAGNPDQLNFYMNSVDSYLVCQHTGGTLLRCNNIGGVGTFAVSANNGLPPGLIELGGTELGSCELNVGSVNNAITLSADQIQAYRTSKIVERASTFGATFVFSSDGSFLKAPLQGSKLNVTKTGADTTFTLQNTGVPGKFTIDAGTAIIRHPASGEHVVIKDLVVNAGATLIIDGAEVLAGSYANNGGVVTTQNGGTLSVSLVVDSGVQVLDAEKISYSGADSLVKSGMGTLYCSGEKVLDMDCLKVANGVFKFMGSSGTTNRWWRLTVKQGLNSGWPLEIGPTRLLTKDLSFADSGSYKQSTVPVSEFAPCDYVCSSYDYDTTKKSPAVIWQNGSFDVNCLFNSPKPSNQNKAS